MLVTRPASAVVVVAAVLVWGAGTAFPQQQRIKNVVMVTWGAEDFPSNPIVSAAIASVVTSDPSMPVEYSAEYLESDRFPAASAEPALRDYIQEKYRGRHVDLVIAYTDSALRFVMDHRSELFPGAPIVYEAVTSPPTLSRTDGGGSTGVLVSVAYRPTASLALRLHPGTRRMFVIARGNPDTVIAAKRELSEIARQVPITFLDAPTIPELLASVRAIPPDSLILYIRYAFDGGERLFTNDVAQLVADAAPVPVYGTSDLYMGRGVIGGVVRSTAATGTRLGEMAMAILKGTPPAAIPIENAALTPILDWRQLQRWDIDESQLPPGSDVRFRIPSAWEAYRRYVVWLTVAVAAQLLLIGALLAQSNRRRLAEAIVRRREAALHKSFERIRQLAGKLITAQETTRANIARDLHDDVCQDLVGISMAVSGLSHHKAIADPDAREALKKVHEWTMGTVEGVRRLSHDLHPAALRLLGVAAALKSYCLEVEKRYAVRVTFEGGTQPDHVEPDVALGLFRIAQESLRNAAVHGEANHLRVALGIVDDDLELTIQDDGRGFDVDTVLRDGGGLGLISMQERARLVGGEVRFTSAPGQGATVQVRVALTADATITPPDNPPARLGTRRPQPARRRLAEIA